MSRTPQFVRTWLRLGYCADPADVAERGLRATDLAGPIALAGAVGSLALLAVWGLAISPIASVPGIVVVMELVGQLVGGVIVVFGIIPAIVLAKYALATNRGEADA